MTTEPGSARRAAVLLTAMLFAATLTISGCALFGKGGSSAATATATLQSAQDDYLQAQMQTEATEQALDELSASPEVDLAQAYRSFAASVDGVQAAGSRLITHADAMHFSGAAYFVESEKSATACVFPPLQRSGNRRPEEIGTYFDAIAEEAWQVKRAYRAFQFDLGLIRDHLARNLTPKSIEVIAPTMLKAKVEGESLKYSLEQALAALERAKTAKARKAGGGG